MAKALELECLKNLLIRCCYFYYVKGEPIVSDHEYDKEFKRLQALEEIYGSDKDSPTQIIWGDVEEQYPNWVKEV